ncbi:MAG: hypothetical protein ABJN42_07405 [Roseibium sp.]|uniref:hypothetical protein n=1 Tax=Roseibium sp. TaxID=1936156 RepID=UPI003298A131
MEMKTLSGSDIRRICMADAKVMEKAFPDGSGIGIITNNQPGQGRGNFQVSLNGNPILGGSYSDSHEGTSLSHRLGNAATAERIAKLDAILGVMAVEAQYQYDEKESQKIENRTAVDLDAFEM